MKPGRWVCSERARLIERVLAAAMLVALAALGAATQASERDGLRRIEQGELILGDAEQPPGDEAPWQPQALLDNWTSTREGTSGFAWYRARFELTDAPQTLQGIGFSRLRTVGAVYVNGSFVGQSGVFGVGAPGPRPQFYAIPPQLLRAGANTVHIRLWVKAGWTGVVSAIRIGSADAVQDDFDRERFLRVTVTQMAGLFAAVVGAVMLLIWVQRRQDSMFGYFGLAALVSAVWITYPLGYWAAVPHRYAYPIIDALGVAKPTLLFMYAMRFAGWRWPRTERAMWGLALGVWLLWRVVDALFPYDAPPTAELTSILQVSFVLPHVASLALVLYILWRLRSLDAALLAAGHVLSVLGLLAYFYWQPLEGVEYGTIHMIPLFLVMGWVLTRRFVASLNSAERLNVELEARVERKRVELEHQYTRTRELEREQAVVQERARIMSDMHDGIGGQLISTLGLVERGETTPQEVATALRECIDDLRLAIDSLAPADEELLPVLGNLRYRIEGQLQRQGIALDWQVQDVPRLACLTPQNVLHVLRILQEALTNVLKHAKASRIRVATRVEPGTVSIDVSDDGRGFGGEAAGRGRGMANMRRRAQALGGELSVSPSPAGTALSLLLPVG